MKAMNPKDEDDVPIPSIKFNIFYNIETTCLEITYDAYKEDYTTGYNHDVKKHPTFSFSSEEKNLIKKSVRNGIETVINDTISQLITTFDFVLLWNQSIGSVAVLVSVSENR